ncbi:hypothetical protein M758_1G332400 [Ceratodon purpureus]|nr:hypothetical protein M758_1G332400 [Ceratodon purpureus]KAG0632499.1 hypothetical protein M758_1G332400 [Ceratodon purpureus]
MMFSRHDGGGPVRSGSRGPQSGSSGSKRYTDDLTSKAGAPEGIIERLRHLRFVACSVVWHMMSYWVKKITWGSLGGSDPPAGEAAGNSSASGTPAGQGDSSSKSGAPLGIKTLISGSLYVLSEPDNGLPNVDVVFIHGLQEGDYKEAYWKTWTVGNNDTECWPMKFLKADFPNARILSVCYDSSASMTSDTGRLDLYAAAQTLASQLVENPGNVGRNSCPVVFVCHSLGGLVAKKIVLHASEQHKYDPKYKNFLQNIRGFHYYSTPHLGSHLADLAVALPYWKKKGKVVPVLTTINNELGRLNESFRRLEDGPEYRDKWVSAAIAEKNETKLVYGFNKLVVREASAHANMNFYNFADADHFGVCKPDSTNSSSYISLKNFIQEAVPTTLISDDDNIM